MSATRQQEGATPPPHRPGWPSWLAVIAILALLSLGLAWVSNDWRSLGGWASFLAVDLVAVALLFGGWRLIRSAELLTEPPRWLLRLLIAAAALRLAAGVIWFVVMPLGGHGTPVELAGYIMADAG